MSSGIDLSQLTPNELKHIREVLNRVKEQGVEFTGKNGKSTLLPLNSDDVIQSSWNNEGEYRPGWDLVFAALDEEIKKDEKEVPPSPHPSPVAQPEDPKKVSQEVLDGILDKVETKEPTPKHEITVVSVESSPTHSEHSHHEAAEEVVEVEQPAEEQPSVAEPEAEEIAVVVPVEEEAPPEEEIEEEKGVLDITFTFFPADGPEERTACPTKGTRFLKTDKTDIMSRKEYVSLTGAKLPVLKGSASGAWEPDENEIHIMVNGAERLKMPQSVIKNKKRTYVKCYMIPDRFHAAKMRSSVVKESDDPNYEHKFIYRGFKVEEFEKNYFEILMCGLTYTIGKVVVMGGIRLSITPESDDDKTVKGSTEEEREVWRKAFEHPGETVSAKITIQENFKPSYH